MLLLLLLLVPIIGISIICVTPEHNNPINLKYNKTIALITCMINLLISIFIFIIFNFSSNQFQFVQEYHTISSFDFYLGIDSLSVYFILLTTIIMPISLLSN